MPAITDSPKTGEETVRVEHGSPVKLRTGQHFRVIVPRRKGACRWSATRARRGARVELIARLEASGPLRFAIFEHDQDGAHDPVCELPAERTPDGLWRARWSPERLRDDDDQGSARERASRGYSCPEFFFRVLGAPAPHASGQEPAALLRVLDRIDRPLRDQDGAPLPGARYVLHLADGSRRRGQLTADSRLIEEDVPPGPVDLELLDGPAWERPALPGRAPLGTAPDAALTGRARATAGLRMRPPCFASVVALTGEPVGVSAEIFGARPGEEAVFTLRRRSDDSAVGEARATIEGGRAHAALPAPDATPEGEDFDLELQLRGRRVRSSPASPLRVYGATSPASGIDRDVRDTAGAPLPGARYILHLADGSRREGRLTARSRLVVDDVPPGAHRLELPDPPIPPAPRLAPKPRPGGAAPDKALTARSRAARAVVLGAPAIFPPVAAPGEPLLLQAPVRGAPDGAAVELVLRDLARGAALETLSATLEAGMAVAPWKASAPAALALEVRYGARRRDSGPRPLCQIIALDPQS